MNNHYFSFTGKTIAILAAMTCFTYSQAEAVAPLISQLGHSYHKRYKGSFPHHRAEHAYKPVIDLKKDKRLIEVATSSNRIWNGVTTTPDGRIFVTFPQVEGPGTQLAQISGNTVSPSIVPFPSAAWNNPPNDNPLQGFLHVTDARVGPDGALWVLDSGIRTGIYSQQGDIPIQRVEGGPRLFKFNIDNLQEMHYDVIDFTDYTESDSALTNFRLNGDTVIITDSGHPGLIVHNLKTDDTSRVLDRANATICHPKMVGSRNLSEINPQLNTLGVRHLEISPDGKTVYFQTACGSMNKIATHWLTDDVSDDERVQHIEKFADTPFTGGTAIDSAGNLYISDITNSSIIKYTPEGIPSIVIQDPQLSWVANMWIDGKGNLWLPASQLGNTPFLNNGQNKVAYPVKLFSINVGALPAPNDHR
ncbi:L-dopachrome tautomerase-related protein [Entomobacter blattae]|uniref:Major royal jelly protein n=1 Tax=Entomobacter blattae TaxID=2762277 RepID=A0A7H1NT93_9PROT|nr:L-dopachrome tautomerase-related protein [Entomobacter blattae]QNT79003.1 Major royal jelly protein [Entomobacter blattae]